MKKAEYLAELQDVLQRDDPVCETDVLDDYEEWDSLAKMALVAYFDKNFNKKLSMNDFEKLKTVTDLMKLTGENISD